jgi:hypothetical protein
VRNRDNQPADLVFYADKGLTAGNTFAPTTRMIIDGTAGNVGIGATAPAKTLDVSGTANIVSNTTIGGNATVAGNTMIGGTAAPSATLDISGTFKLSGGPNTETCIGNTHGMIRLDSTTGHLEICWH